MCRGRLGLPLACFHEFCPFWPYLTNAKARAGEPMPAAWTLPARVLTWGGPEGCQALRRRGGWCASDARWVIVNCSIDLPSYCFRGGGLLGLGGRAEAADLFAASVLWGTPEYLQAAAADPFAASFFRAAASANHGYLVGSRANHTCAHTNATGCAVRAGAYTCVCVCVCVFACELTRD